MRLPTKLPHSLAGTWVELLKRQYILPWANTIHARELYTTLAIAGFVPAHVPTPTAVSLENVLNRFFLAPVFFIGVQKKSAS